MDPAAPDIAPPMPTRPPCESEWGAFVDSYGRAILDWFRQLDIVPEDATALTRDVLTQLAREFAAIANEPTTRFRAWLNYAGHAAWCRLMEDRVGEGSGRIKAPIMNLVLSVEAHDRFLKALDEECSHQRRREVLPRVQPLADPADWEAFYLTVLEGQPPTEVATHLQASELAVRAAVFRVRRLLGRALQELEDHC